MKKLLAAMFAAPLMVGLLASSLAQAEEHEWTNKQGKTIKAGFVSAGEEAVTISMGGKSYVVKLADLTPQSRALAAKLRVQKSKAREPQNDKTPLVKTSEVPKIDLDDKETRNRIAAEAIDSGKLQKKGVEGDQLFYAPNQQTPYTGWGKLMWGNEQVKLLAQFEDGKADGLFTSWHENGQKSSEINYKDSKPDGHSTIWHENGQKLMEQTFKTVSLSVYRRFDTQTGRSIVKSLTNFKDGVSFSGMHLSGNPMATSVL